MSEELISAPQVHVLWTPGEIYDSEATVYCGFMLQSGNQPCQTNPKLALVNSVRAVSGDTAGRAVSGRGAMWQRTYKLCLEQWMIQRVRGYCTPTGEAIAGEARVWIETDEDLSKADYDGWQIAFPSGAVNLITSTPRTREPGTNMWNVYLQDAIVEAGGVTITGAFDPIGMERWFMQRMDGYMLPASIGVVCEVNGVLDIDSGAIGNKYWEQWYETQVQAVNVVDVYRIELPYMCYEMQVQQRLIGAPSDGQAY